MFFVWKETIQYKTDVILQHTEV